jgi:hypothetical protein
MIPFRFSCRLVKLPERQIQLIEQIVYHWVNRQDDYELYWNVEAGFTDKDTAKRIWEKRDKDIADTSKRMWGKKDD